MWIPVSLVMLRCAIAPFLLWDAWDGHVSPLFLVGYGVAVVSDIFDGIIARRLGVSTEKLRTADSWADRWLYVCVAIAAWLTHADVIRAFQWPLLTVVGLQALWWVVNLAKYGRPASYHTYSAKAWGLSLIAMAIALFGYGTGGLALWIAVVLGCLHTLEEIAMTLLLPTWHHDVLSIVHAVRLRRVAQPL
ncbi:MAG: CDP-alcohol phosphatidyltransferase family protein [Elainellaceae cyanobacterium]